MASHEKARWIDRNWWLFVIAFGILCVTVINVWNPRW
jgi:hypothetical protein